MAQTYLDFERSVAELDKQAEALAEKDAVAAQEMQGKAATELKRVYSKLGPWEKTQVARHPARPHYSDYVTGLVTDYTPLAGDRTYGDDHALLGGTGKIRGRSVVVMGHEKGTDLDTRLKHNFGMARPEGYRKAVRLMNLAERFNLPVISFVDTAGAFPGRGAEERGQAEAIARSIDRGLSLKVPFISIITGEGGSGGAVAIATADSVLMLDHSIYSVISPEGCASILWRDGSRAEDAAKAMKITAKDLKRLKVVDDIIKEPAGGAHRDQQETIKRVGAKIMSELDRLQSLGPDALLAQRREKFLNIGRSLMAG